MSKFKDVVSMLMAGDPDGAALAFVDMAAKKLDETEDTPDPDLEEDVEDVGDEL